jgi:virulence factor Mce-like protein
MRAPRKTASEVFENPILVGTLTILIALVAVYLSYIAENGLPFVPSYSINSDVENAAQLVKNADVRIGGARVGQVLTITAEPRDLTWPHPYARLKLQLQRSLEPLPLDTTYLVRTASVLGGKYLEIIPGRLKSGLADGGTFHLSPQASLCRPGQASACDHDQGVVDLDTAFRTFGPATARGLRNAVGELGNAFSGRGTQFNDAIYSLRRLIGPAESLLALLASPHTHLAQFISGAAATTSALAGVAPTVSSLLADGATTFSSLQDAGSALGSTIDQLPGTESAGTTVLTNAQPVLVDAASIVQDLRPAAALLPLASDRLDAILVNATPVFKRVPRLAGALDVALAAVGRLAHDPAAIQSFRVLGSNDLASFGSSAFVGLGAILRAVAPAQFACNVAGIWARNLASYISEGDSAGTWQRTLPIIGAQSLLASRPSPDLHANPYPIEQGGQCQGGNEPFRLGQAIGNSQHTGATVDNTVPPPGALERGRAAGLVP